MISLHDVGVGTAVAAMGTSLTSTQLGMAAKAGRGKVVLLLDADDAGENV